MRRELGWLLSSNNKASTGINFVVIHMHTHIYIILILINRGEREQSRRPWLVLFECYFTEFIGSWTHLNMGRKSLWYRSLHVYTYNCEIVMQQGTCIQINSVWWTLIQNRHISCETIQYVQCIQRCLIYSNWIFFFFW